MTCRFFFCTWNFITSTRIYRLLSVRLPWLSQKECRRLVHIFSAFFPWSFLDEKCHSVKPVGNEVWISLFLRVTASGAGYPRRSNFGAALVPDHLTRGCYRDLRALIPSPSPKRAEHTYFLGTPAALALLGVLVCIWQQQEQSCHF